MKRTQDFNWSFASQGAGAIAIAAKEIAAGKTVKFEMYNRDAQDKTIMNLAFAAHYGICEIEGHPALRESISLDLAACGSHSVLPSWYAAEIVTDPVYIAAMLAAQTSRYTDVFRVDI